MRSATGPSAATSPTAVTSTSPDKPRSSELIKECVDKVNQDISRDTRLANSQIRRFLILHKELDADDGELTRTRKVRRSFVGERFDVLVEALYSDQPQCHIETEVTFEDGRTGLLSADVGICNAEVFSAVHAVAGCSRMSTRNIGDVILKVDNIEPLLRRNEGA